MRAGYHGTGSRGAGSLAYAATRALDEIRRVLRPGGRFYATTNAWTHQIELREWTARFAVDSRMTRPRREAASFDAEAAVEELGARFERVRVTRRDGTLAITDAAPLVDYLLSVCDEHVRGSPRLAALRRHVERQIAIAGCVHVTTAALLLQADRPAV